MSPWSVVSGQWSVVSGQWSVVSGQWSVVSNQSLSRHLTPSYAPVQSTDFSRLGDIGQQKRRRLKSVL